MAGLVRFIRANDVSAIVADMRDSADVRVDAALEAAAVDTTIPVTVVVTLSQRSARDVFAILNAELLYRVVLRDDDTDRNALMTVQDAGIHAAWQRRFLQAASLVTHDRWRSLVVALSCVGARRSSVHDLARAIGLTARSLERQLSQARLPQARVLLRSTLLLRAVWLMQEHDWPIKRIARECGLVSSAALSNLVRRHAGASLRTIEQTTEFDRELASFLQRLNRSVSSSSVA